MLRGFPKGHKIEKNNKLTGPIRILGISSGKRSQYDCAAEDPASLWLLKLALREAEKAGAKTQLIDLRDLQIGACKECYSTCPAQCRFNEKINMCDCYKNKEDHFFIDKNKVLPIEHAYDHLDKKTFFEIYHDHGRFAKRDDMWLVYEAMRKADGIIFATSTNYYGRPALFQAMFSRMCALDGGVESLWGDGKNLKNSIKYAKDPKAQYKQRLYGRWCAFINCSKEGDSVSPNLMKACTMLGMKTIPLGVAYKVNWYDDPTHRKDVPNTKKDEYTLSLTRRIGKTIVEEAKSGHRYYGRYSTTV
ncbi:MAG: NAD(P)H-dependent oxidoreductase [Nanoarchaeota archaeon]|nr:NAD(P)H-dependent oxidoreductase [Nanoarchaeota archaeon]